jgi:GntR family transcriptional regulator
LDEEDPEIVLIKRARFKEERSFAFTMNYLPVGIGKNIAKTDLYKKPLLKILEQDLGIRFSEAFQTIEASFANREVAEQLEIPTGSPILFVERIMYTTKRRPVEVVQSSYRGDFYKYIVRLKNVKRKDGTAWLHQSE